MTTRILVGDCRDVLAGMPERSVHTCVTSPPYFGLRDYGTGEWDGGDAACDHDVRRWDGPKQTQGAMSGHAAARDRINRQGCECGAVRIDRQLGLEPTVESYVEALVGVFRGVRRVLRDDGTLWLNLGDSMLPDGNEADVPHLVARAMTQDGWVRRSTVVWHKPNPLPESVRNRPTKSHEYVFLFSKKASGYYWDAESVKEPHSENRPWGTNRGTTVASKQAGARGESGDDSLRAGASFAQMYPEGGRNIRSVWTIATQPYPEAHFATFPPKLVEPCIKAGTSERGCCPSCGAPWRRVVERIPMEIRNGPKAGGYGSRTTDGLSGTMLAPASSITTGWQPGCACDGKAEGADVSAPSRSATEATEDDNPNIPHDPVPAVVLDPFGGAGTVGLVADRLGRDSILIELNSEYAQQARDRIRGDAPMFARFDDEPRAALAMGAG